MATTRFWLEGVSRGPRGERMTLERCGGGWRAVVHECGEVVVYGTFADEDAACRWVLDYFGQPSTVGTRTRTA